MRARSLTRGALIAVALTAALIVPAPAATVRAEPTLVWSEPQADGFLTDMPVRVVIALSQNVGPGTAIVVADIDGNDLTAGPTTRTDNQATVGLIPLVTGLYTVNWRAISADDGAETSGSFQFFHLHLH